MTRPSRRKGLDTAAGHTAKVDALVSKVFKWLALGQTPAGQPYALSDARHSLMILIASTGCTHCTQAGTAALVRLRSSAPQQEEKTP